MGGHPLLHFEEGRARQLISLGDKPITSYAQAEKARKAIGAEECGGQVPPSVAKTPKSRAMKEYLSKDNKRRWV
jgi:hypothetical protein